jgi:hypothetical protein
MSLTTHSIRRSALPTFQVLIVGALLFGFALQAGARPAIRQSFFAAYPSVVASRLDNLPSIQGHCGVCHYRFTGGGTRNPYGAAVEDAIPGYPNNDQGRQQAMHSIENQDSDGDTYSQLVEITDLAHYANTPTFPGLTPGNVNLISNVDPNDVLASRAHDRSGHAGSADHGHLAQWGKLEGERSTRYLDRDRQRRRERSRSGLPGRIGP